MYSGAAAAAVVHLFPTAEAFAADCVQINAGSGNRLRWLVCLGFVAHCQWLAGVPDGDRTDLSGTAGIGHSFQRGGKKNSHGDTEKQRH